MTDAPAPDPKPAKPAKSDTDTTPRRRRRKARLAIYDRLPAPFDVGGVGTGTIDLDKVEHVVVDLAGTSEPPEIFSTHLLEEARGFVAGAVWAGAAEAVD